MSHSKLIRFALSISLAAASVVNLAAPTLAQDGEYGGQYSSNRQKDGQYYSNRRKAPKFSWLEYLLTDLFSKHYDFGGWSNYGKEDDFGGWSNYDKEEFPYQCYGVEPGADVNRDLSEAPKNLRRRAMEALDDLGIDITKNSFISFGSETEDGTRFFEFQAYQEGNLPCGVEVDVTANGEVREVETEIKPSDLPQAVRNALEDEYGEEVAFIFVEKSIRFPEKNTVYEVEFQSNEQKFDVAIDPEGNILSVEEEGAGD
jgi:uncharacterized membrane protein YkoI